MSCNTILNDINTDLSCHHTNIVCVKYKKMLKRNNEII